MKTYADIKGDGGSRVVEQLSAQANLITDNLSSVKHLIAIGSAKGGVGKSTLTMQIGFALASLTKRVSLLDLDFNGPSLAKLAGLEGAPLVPGRNGLVVPRTRSGLGVLSFGSMVERGCSLEFNSVAKGESYTWRATKEFATLGDILSHTYWGELDFLLLDLPPGSERTFQFAEYFGEKLNILLVTIPSEISQGVVRRGLHALSALPNRILGYVENMSGYYCTDCQAVRPLFPTARETNLGIPKLASVVFDPELARICDEEGDLSQSPDLPSAKEIKELAERLLALAL